MADPAPETLVAAYLDGSRKVSICVRGSALSVLEYSQIIREIVHQTARLFSEASGHRYEDIHDCIMHNLETDPPPATGITESGTIQ